jgi:chromosome partitioning protein
MNNSPASGFKLIVNDIGQEIFSVWQATPNASYIHPPGEPAPVGRVAFRNMFQYEVADANTASVVSGACGIPIVYLTAAQYDLPGRRVLVNQTQLDKQIPNVRELVRKIE